MDTFLLAVDNNGEILYGDLPGELQYLLFSESEQFVLKDVSYDGRTKKSKFCTIKKSDTKLLVFTTDPKYINSSKLFRELVRMSMFTLESIVKVKEKLSFDHNAYVQDLIHNLTSLNSYNIQDLFSLIPQHVLTQNINKQHDVIKGIIIEQPNVAVSTLLNLIKYNLAMKVEFSVFEKTMIQNPFLQKQNLSVRQIILSVLQIFIEDFDRLKITVSVDSCEKMLNVDYDIFFVSLYYLLENAVKYSMRNSKFNVIFKEEKDGFSVIFKMISAKIEDHEKTKLCNKNFRAASAKALTNEGKGIGMHRVLKTLKMNDAEIEIIPRVTEYQKTVNGIVYEHNEFKIKFPGQQDWFKVNNLL